MKKKVFIYGILFISGLLAGALGYPMILENMNYSSNSHTTFEELYTCGMHPEIIEKEAGTCPICGMNLTPIKTSNNKSQDRGEIIYWRAPMDPNEIYDEPGKSKMGMDLVPVYQNESSSSGVVTVDGSILQSINVKVESVQKRNIHSTVVTNGILSTDETQEFIVTTKNNGWIEKLYVNYTGQKVNTGDKLVDIYSPELFTAQQELISAVEYRDQIKSDSILFNSTADELVQNAIKKLELFDIDKEEIERIISSRNIRKYITLYAPIDGTVLTKNVLEGEKINAGKSLLKIANLNNLWLKADIYESELNKISIGSSADIRFNYNPNKVLSGKIAFIYPTVDPLTRTISVRINITNLNSELKPAMFGDVTIHGKDFGESISIPQQALIRSGKNNLVIRALGEGRFKPVSVKLGLYSMGFYQVLEGLKENDQIVSSGQFLIDSESRLQSAVNLFQSTEVELDEHDHQNEIIRTGVIDVESVDINRDGKVFQDPMDWNVISDQDGRCPICNMFLVEVSIEEAQKNLIENGFEIKE